MGAKLWRGEVGYCSIVVMIMMMLSNCEVGRNCGGVKETEAKFNSIQLNQKIENIFVAVEKTAICCMDYNGWKTLAIWGKYRFMVHSSFVFTKI